MAPIKEASIQNELICRTILPNVPKNILKIQKISQNRQYKIYFIKLDKRTNLSVLKDRPHQKNIGQCHVWKTGSVDAEEAVPGSVEAKVKQARLTGGYQLNYGVNTC